MIVTVKRDRELHLKNAQNTQNENRAETITLVVPEEYEDYNKKIVFVTPNETVWDVITNNEYKITNAITKYDEVKFYIWLTKEVNGESIDFRTQTKPLRFYHNQDASDEITQEQINGVNTVVNLLEEEIDKVENLDLDVEKIGTVATLTLTKKDGTTKEVEITDGTDGQDGYTPQKGVDYFTQEDIQEIENGVKTDLQETVLIDYSLITETGSKIDLSINTTNYKLTAILKDKNNNIICTSNEIDLPLETMVVSASYDNTTKEIILTLQNGTTVRFSVADLVSGLVSETQLQTILANYYTKTEVNALLENKVDKVQGKGLSTEDYTTVEKTKLSGIEAEANKTVVDNELDNESENPVQNKVINTEIGKLQIEDTRLKATIPTTTGTGQTVTLNKTAEMEFVKPPLPMGNSEQDGEPSLDNEVPITNLTGDVEVAVKNKNLLPAITGNTVEGIALTQNADGSFIINGTASAGGYKRYLFGETITFPAGNYTIYFENSALGSNGEISYDIVDINKDLRFNKAITTTGKHVFYHTINEDLTCTSFNTWVSNGVSINNAQIYMMIISGTHDEEDILEYVKHKEQVFTFPLGNEKLMLGDYLADDGIHHVRGQDVFDGSEDEAWAKIYGSIENGIALYSVDKNHKQVDGLSDKFVMRNSLSIWYNGEGVTTKWRNDRIGFMINGERINNDYSIIAIRNLMNNNPVTVEYELAEEVIVPYTTAQQTVYNAIKQAISYEGQTNISSNQNAIFNVEAYLDTKVILSEKVDKIAGKGLSTNDFTNTYKNSVDSNTIARHTHTNKTVLDGIVSSDITNWNGKQNETDNSLNTTNKTITGAINEVYSIARGANQAVSYSNYQAMITAFNSLANDIYNVGQNVMIVTLNVPDLWISGIESTSSTYTYTTDETFTTELSTNGYVQVGYYKLSALETQKVDLTNYEQNTNKTTTISSSSTNAQYPSAKAVYDYIQSLDGDEVSY